MKYAIIGTGKTGGQVVDLIDKNDLIGTFNSRNVPEVEQLRLADVIILFVPGTSLPQLLPWLLQAKTAVVSGATGYDFDNTFNLELKKNDLVWIQGHNFSLGMNLVKKVVEFFGKFEDIFDDPQFSIHEIHHTNKKDAPSGTALRIKSWLNRDAPITHERIGDVVGVHRINLTTPAEEIELQHTAKTRQLFAKGALWAAKQISELDPGLHWFEDLVSKKINI